MPLRRKGMKALTKAAKMAEVLFFEFQAYLPLIV